LSILLHAQREAHATLTLLWLERGAFEAMRDLWKSGHEEKEGMILGESAMKLLRLE
jgi:hypothetical protein